MPRIAQNIPAFDRKINADYDWGAPSGQDQLRLIVAPHITYSPDQWQVEGSAAILNGTDVLAVSATGDGKSSLLYFPVLARPGMVNIVISPLDLLEDDMVSVR